MSRALMILLFLLYALAAGLLLFAMYQHGLPAERAL